ncbi:tyrosine-type recombinase/integrase [Oscillibacter sp.]|uniref:tyrosine-type recombinase/integrase n=1 Tax=Oscillibacter sp. TaxID=1945593 RepID=UPI0028ACA332|nr:tyrosine-type recombinase/integrase [Oscillibacter sp.]
MIEKPFFTGPFAPLCERFVSQKRAIGLVYETQAKRLRQFDNFCKDHAVEGSEITEELVTAYCVRLPNENDNSRRDRVYAMRTFAEFLSVQGYPSYVLPETPKSVAAHTPYIFTKDEIGRLFERLDALERTNYTTGHLMFPLLFRILYGCGLRISEALSLLKQDVDVDAGILYINHGKNDRERIVPMSVSLLDKCRDFLSEAHSDTPDDMPLFYAKNRMAFSRHAIAVQFRNYLWDIGVPYQGKDIGPRIHDLRHTFICHNIQRWAEAGIPIHSKLPILSKYVGHANTTATQWYLRLSAEAYPHIREICERELGCIYADIPCFAEEGGDE